MKYANLHIGLYLWDRDRYAVNLSFSSSSSDADSRAEIVGLPLAAFDRKQFLLAENDPREYGLLLGQGIFATPKAHQVFQNARTTAQQLGVPLRVQLMLSPKMPNLHDLRWETLRNPADDRPLLLGDEILFSRYLASDDTRPVRLRQPGQLRALVVVANPANLERFGFHPIDVDAEIARASEGLRDLKVTLFTSSSGPASMSAIIQELRQADDGYDVLYLACHGALVEGEPRLWLEKDNGEAAIVSGVVLADRLSELTHRPRLVMLVSCESAGSGDDAARKDEGALAAVGPRLAAAGVPAVLAMQGKVSMRSIEAFLPPFFDALRREGQIDLAVARGRAAIQDQHDCWMPVLFMRSNTGRLWIKQGMEPGGFMGWQPLLNHIEAGECTPVIGPGVLDEYFGSSQEIARRWAELYRYPMAPPDREELPQIAQFLAVNTSPNNAKLELKAYLHREMLERYGDRVPGLRREGEVWDLLAEIGRWRRNHEAHEPHKVLAKLGCPLYITTNPDRLLLDALKEQDVDVRAGAFDWTSSALTPDPLFADGSYWPEASCPLVYHLFGSFVRYPQPGPTNMRSLVLTQDDYFQYLISMIKNKSSIPEPVAQALTSSALFFIGFQLSDWSFRILLQSILERGGSSGLSQFSHVAVQIDPHESQFQDPEMARRYLDRLAKTKVGNLSVYWGSVSSFIKELDGRLSRRQAPVETH